MRMSRHDLWNSEEDFRPLCDMVCNLKPVMKSSPHDLVCSKEVFNHATQLFLKKYEFTKLAKFC